MCWVLFAVCSGCNQMESWAQGQFCHLAKCALHSPGGERQRQRGRGKAAKDHQGCLHNSFSGSKISPTNCTLFFIGPKSNHCLVNLSKLINGFLCCFMNCVTRAPLLYFVRSWVALSLVCEWISQSVRHAWHPSKFPLFAIYKGMNVLYWPSIINYQLLPPHSVLYWPNTQLHHLVTHSWANWI